MLSEMTTATMMAMIHGQRFLIIYGRTPLQLHNVATVYPVATTTYQRNMQRGSDIIPRFKVVLS